MLANSKPSVTSLGPLTVKRQPPRQGGPPLAVTSLVESTSGGSLRVQLHSRGHSPLMSRLCSALAGDWSSRGAWEMSPSDLPDTSTVYRGASGSIGSRDNTGVRNVVNALYAAIMQFCRPDHESDQIQCMCMVICTDIERQPMRSHYFL